MLERLTGASLKGGKFDNWIEIDGIFSRAFNILYGTNGSGKSTLAKALRDYGKAQKRDDFELNFLPNNPTLPMDGKIFVFNEDFINENMKLTEDTSNSSINAIVMFGSQIAENSDIEAKKTRIGELESDNVTQQQIVDSHEAANKKNDIISLLKQSGDYGDRYRELKCQKNLPNVNILTRVIDEILEEKDALVSATFDISRTELSAKTDRVKSVVASEKFAWNHSQAGVAFSISAVNALLAKVVQRPNLSQRERWLIEASERMLAETTERIVRSEVERCPVCHQPISQDYRQHLADEISSYMNKEVENHIEELKCLKERIADFQQDDFQLKPSENAAVINVYRDAVGKLNQEIERVRQALQKKIDNPFEQVAAIVEDELQRNLSDLDNAIKALEEVVKKYNAFIDNIANERNSIEQASKILTFIEHRTDFDSLGDLIKKENDASAQINRNNQELVRLRRELAQAQNQNEENTSAMEFINQCLRYVFMESSHLQLAEGDRCYRVMVDGRPVDIRNISTGERNIMALAYFFATLFEKKEENEKYKNEMLVVLDDPISSFDYSNKAGVMTLLQDQIQNIVTGRKESKVLLITHDLEVAASMQTIYSQNICGYRNRMFAGDPCFTKEEKEIYKDPNQHNKGKDTLPYIYQLLDGELFTKDSHSDYQENLLTLYWLAKADSQTLNSYPHVGNVIRQVLETYANLMYNSTYTYMMSKDRLEYELTTSDERKKATQVSFFTQSLCRFVLNSSSHSDTNVRLENYHSQFSGKEMQKYARVALLFIYLTNKEHLFSYLDDTASQIKFCMRDWERLFNIQE